MLFQQPQQWTSSENENISAKLMDTGRLIIIFGTIGDLEHAFCSPYIFCTRSQRVAALVSQSETRTQRTLIVRWAGLSSLHTSAIWFSFSICFDTWIQGGENQLVALANWSNPIHSTAVCSHTQLCCTLHSANCTLQLLQLALPLTITRHSTALYLNYGTSVRSVGVFWPVWCTVILLTVKL